MVTVRSESGSQNRDSELKRGLKGSGIRTVEWGDAGLGRVLSVVEVAHNPLSLCPPTPVPVSKHPGAKIPNAMCTRARSLSLNSCARSRSCTSRRSFPVSVTISTPSRVRLHLSLSLSTPLFPSFAPSLSPAGVAKFPSLSGSRAHSLHQRSWHPLPY